VGDRVQWASPSETDQHLFDPAGRWVTNVGQFSTIPWGSRFLAVYDGSETHLDHANNVASTTMRTDYSGAAARDILFYPWGGVWEAWGNDGYNFAGLPWRDVTTNTDLTTFRNFSPGLGRWLSPDPLAGDITNPQSLNRYPYVVNNPTSFTDPLGLLLTAQYACYNPMGICAGNSGWAGAMGGFIDTSFWDTEGDYVTEFTWIGEGWGAWGSAGGDGAGGTAANNGKPSPCNSLSSSGGTIPVNAPFGQLRFQFNGAGNLIGLGLQLTGMSGYSASGLSIPPNTFAGFTQLSPGTVQFGFSNPVNVGSGFSQAYFQTATFSGGRFTSVQGAYAPLGIPLGSSSGNSSVLQWFLNGNSSTASQAQNFANLLTSVASLVSNSVSCQDMFGGG